MGDLLELRPLRDQADHGHSPSRGRKNDRMSRERRNAMALRECGKQPPPPGPALPAQLLRIRRSLERISELQDELRVLADGQTGEDK